MRTHGADDRHTNIQVDGMSVNSAMGDGNIQAYNDDALAQQVVFQTSALPAEVAAGGVRVNMIPKDGGNTVQRRRLLRRHRAELAGRTTSTTSCAQRASSTATSCSTCRTSTSTSAGRS